MQSIEYFRFVTSRVESDLRTYPVSPNLSKVIKILKVLKNSNNLLKDIFILSGIKDLKSLGTYLLFMLKKAESDEIKFDNLIENLYYDKDYIKTELINNFKLSAPSAAEEKREFVPEEDDGTFSDETSSYETIETVHIVTDKKFKIEEIENELVTEEFQESEIEEDAGFIQGKNYLELIQSENDVNESVFNLPTDEAAIPEIDEFAYELPKTSKKEDDQNDTNIPQDKITFEEIKEDTFPEEAKEETVTQNLQRETIEKILENEGEKTLFDLHGENIPDEENVSTGDANIIKEEENILQEGQNIPEEEETIPVEEEMPQEETKILQDEELKVEETAEQEVTEIITEPEPVNTLYIKYETELLERNKLLVACFEELRCDSFNTETQKEQKAGIIENIVEHCDYMEDYSRQMSFEIITGIYNTIKLIFSRNRDEYLTNIDLLKDSISLVESLIKGEDFSRFDAVMKEMESLKTHYRNEILEEESLEKANKEKTEIEKHLITKYSDANQRQKLLILKQRILEVENIFNSLESIKGEYQAYEALRQLSHTFAHFKEMVNVAKSLEMRKIAQLTEASYIFIKFIQNYRLNPFEEEIKEVLSYIIYNFKLMFLDKPTKDIDLFISYLNDPVKIFEKKKKKNN